MQIKVMNGTLGMGSPQNDALGLIVVTRGTMSRTGRALGNVDEGYCVQVTASTPRGEGGERATLSVERLYAADLWNAEALNRGGGGGAYEECPPADAEVEAAIDRARALLLAGQRSPEGGRVQICLVQGGPPGSQHVYRLRGSREELGREAAVQRAAEELRGREPGADAVVERRPSHGHRWDAWRRYAVHPSGSVVRVDR